MQSHPNNNFQQTNKYNYDPQDEHSTQDESSDSSWQNQKTDVYSNWRSTTSENSPSSNGYSMPPLSLPSTQYSTGSLLQSKFYHSTSSISSAGSSYSPRVATAPTPSSSISSHLFQPYPSSLSRSNSGSLKSSPYSSTIPYPTVATRPRLNTILWEDENTMCYQLECRGICVSRRQDNNMINGTKLLNAAGMSRGKRDGILKNERGRMVVKIGAMHLKGVWIPFDRAKILATQFKIINMLYPLFSDNPSSFLYTSTIYRHHNIGSNPIRPLISPGPPGFPESSRHLGKEYGRYPLYYEGTEQAADSYSVSKRSPIHDSTKTTYDDMHDLSKPTSPKLKMKSNVQTETDIHGLHQNVKHDRKYF